MADERVFAKCAWRLIPFITLIFFTNFLDRVNAGFAALTMNKDLGFTPVVFGFGAGVLFVSYSLCQVPANIVLARVGATRFVFSIMVLWAVFSASTAFVRGPTDFYILRFLLGAAESGFFPGMMYYLSLWFPATYRARLAAVIIVGNPVAFIFGGPMSTLLLDMDGIAGFHGWQWLFLIEGAPVLLLAVAVLKLLPDGPKIAPFLTSTEKDFIVARLAREDGSKPAQTGAAFRDARIFALALVLFAILGAGYGLLLWLPQIVQAMGFSNRQVGFITALPAGAAAAAMVWWGRSSDVSGERVWHLTFAMLFGAAGFAVTAVSHSNLTQLFALSAAFVGVFCTLPIVHNLPGTFLRGNAVAAGLGIFNTIGQFGGFVAPYIIGITKEQSGGYAAGMMISAAGLGIGALIVLAHSRALVSPPNGRSGDTVTIDHLLRIMRQKSDICDNGGFS
jgi:MFS transporter, ACS family, tartrate transporter